jgi:hypothetical protein
MVQGQDFGDMCNTPTNSSKNFGIHQKMVHTKAKFFEIFKEALNKSPFYGASAQLYAAGI